MTPDERAEALRLAHVWPREAGVVPPGSVALIARALIDAEAELAEERGRTARLRLSAEEVEAVADQLRAALDRVAVAVDDWHGYKPGQWADGYDPKLLADLVIEILDRSRYELDAAAVSAISSAGHGAVRLASGWTQRSGESR